MSKGLIVLAEDETTLREIYAAALRNQGFTVIAVADGQEAVTVLTRTQPRLIVLDVMMPNLDGIEACKRIRGMHGRDTPILFLTAADGFEILHDCVAAGGNDFLIKTDRIDSIITRIAYWAVRARLAATTAPVGVEPIRARIAQREAEVEATREETPGATQNSKVRYEAEQIRLRASALLSQARANARVGYGRDTTEMRMLLGYAAGLYDALISSHMELKSHLIEPVRSMVANTGALEDTSFLEQLENWTDTALSPEFQEGAEAARQDVEHGQNTAIEPLGLIDRLRPDA